MRLASQVWRMPISRSLAAIAHVIGIAAKDDDSDGLLLMYIVGSERALGLGLRQWYATAHSL